MIQENNVLHHTEQLEIEKFTYSLHLSIETIPIDELRHYLKESLLDQRRIPMQQYITEVMEICQKKNIHLQLPALVFVRYNGTLRQDTEGFVIIIEIVYAFVKYMFRTLK